MKNNKGFVGIFIVIGILIAGGATYALVQRSVLKSFFQTGDKPNQEKKSDVGADVDANVASETKVSGDKPTEKDFGDTIDSSLNLVDDGDLTGSKEYNPTKNYQTGDTVIKSTPIYQAEVTSPDPKDSKPNTDQPSEVEASASTSTGASTGTGTSSR